MRRAIQFHGQPAFRTVKVDNVSTYAELSSKLLAQKFSILEACPEDGFGRCSGFPKILAKRFL